jgi:hypothetical protein
MRGSHLFFNAGYCISISRWDPTLSAGIDGWNSGRGAWYNNNRRHNAGGKFSCYSFGIGGFYVGGRKGAALCPSLSRRTPGELFYILFRQRHI